MFIEVLPSLSLALQDLRDANSIALVDLSDYATVPDSSHRSLQITPPGYSTVNVLFTPQNVNIYKSVDLGITASPSGCTQLPDGIYEIVYSINPPGSNPSSIDQKFIKIDQIKCKYQHAFLKLRLQCDCSSCEQRDYIQEIRKVKLYIDGSVAACNDGNYVMSQEWYSRANFLLSHICSKYNINFHNSCGCGCK